MPCLSKLSSNLLFISIKNQLFLRSLSKFEPITFIASLPSRYAHHPSHQVKQDEEYTTNYAQFNWVQPPSQTIASVKTIRKNWELIPLLVVMALAGLGGIYIMIYSLFKNDVMLTSKQRHGIEKPWDNIDPTKTRKLYVPYEGARVIPELEALKKIMKEK